MMTMNYGEAIADALKIEMRRDPNVYIAGEDVGKFGGSFGVTGYGVFSEFGPERVLDTPISETAIVGHAVGAAAAGLRPAVEILFMDFLPICMDELCNQAAKVHYMFGGQLKCPMVLRTALGAGMGTAAASFPVARGHDLPHGGADNDSPATPYDAKGLLISAIRDDNPVVFLEHKMLYALKGEVPEGEYTIPIGKADVKREGSDVTLVCWSAMVRQCLAAAERSRERRHQRRSARPAHADPARQGSDPRVGRQDPQAGHRARGLSDRRLRRRDRRYRGLPRASTCWTRRSCGWPGPDTPVPFSPALEAEWIVKADKIAAAVRARGPQE